jgi:hypothetical protein
MQRCPSSLPVSLKSELIWNLAGTSSDVLSVEDFVLLVEIWELRDYLEGDLSLKFLLDETWLCAMLLLNMKMF